MYETFEVELAVAPVLPAVDAAFVAPVLPAVDAAFVDPDLFTWVTLSVLEAALLVPVLPASTLTLGLAFPGEAELPPFVGGLGLLFLFPNKFFIRIQIQI